MDIFGVIVFGAWEILLVVLLVLVLFGGGVGYYRRSDWGYAPSGGFGLILLILLIVLLVRIL